MRAILQRVACTLVLSGWAGVLLGGEAPKGLGVDDLIKELGKPVAAPEAAPDAALLSACPKAVDELVAKIATGDVAGGDSKLEAITNRVGTPGRKAERLAVATALVAKLGPDVPTPARVWVLRHLERIGHEEAVQPVAALLGDAELREPARRALIGNPDPSAVEVLRAALGKAPAEDKAWRVALIDALGARAEPANLKLLIAQAEDADDDIRSHACQALARHGDASGAPVIAACMKTGSDRAQHTATDSYLALADRLTAKGEKEPALAIYRSLLGPKSHLKCAALIGIGKAGSAADVDLLVGAFAGNEAERGAATQGLILLPDPKATPAIAEKAKLAAAPVKAILIRVLGDRGDAAILQTVLDAAKDADEGVRIAALEAMGKLKAPAAIPALIAAIKAAKDAERDKAEWALARIPGKEATDALVAALPGAAKDAKCVLLRSLGYRKDPSVLDTLLAAAKEKEEDVAEAAFRSIGQLGDPKALPTIFAALKTATGKARDGAVYALRRTQGKEATAAIVEAARSAEPAVLAPVIDVLTWRDDPAVKPLLLDAAKNADAGVQAAALAGLAIVKDPSAVPLLIAAASKGEGPVRETAIRSSLQYGDEIAKADKAAALAIFTAALDHKLVPQPEERALALRALGAVGDLASLDKMRSEFPHNQTAGAAHEAAFRIADRLEKGGDKDGAIAAYTRLMAYSSDRGQIERAQKALAKLGAQGNLPRAAGFITHWWTAGPFPNPNNELFSKPLPPEKDGVNLDEAMAALEGQKVPWKAYHTGDPAGIVNLDVAVGKEAAAAALLNADITVPAATEAVLKLGYEDGIVAYVNGKKVHDRAGSHFRIDDQRVNVRLSAGVNRLLLKVVSTNPGWSVSARLTTREGLPLEFTEREK